MICIGLEINVYSYMLYLHCDIKRYTRHEITQPQETDPIFCIYQKCLGSLNLNWWLQSWPTLSLSVTCVLAKDFPLNGSLDIMHNLLL